MKRILDRIKKIKLEDILYLFIILCPLLDMTSFIFRNIFNTSLSPSTFLRPIIPILMIAYIFFTRPVKKKLIIGFAIYVIYAVAHLLLFNQLKTESSYGGILNELQYITNYSFMILNLFIYAYVFKNKESEKLRKSVFIALSIYVLSIFIAIATGTSSPTYIEGLGYKGWFESGNTICAILTLSLCAILPLVKEKKFRYFIIAILLLTGVFLTTLVGTRTGLVGFVLVLLFYIILEVIISLFRKTKINKRVTIAGCVIIVLMIGTVVFFGSKTFERRAHLREIESNIVDNQTGEIAHISGDLLDLKKKIEKNELPESYMSKGAQQSILDLFEYAEKTNMVNNDMRKQQLVYNYYLVKNDSNPLKILFGNGFKTQFRELVMEMEFPAFLFNFGIIGFMLYMGPFLAIFIYGCYIAIKNIRKIDAEYLLLILGDILAFGLSFLSGYVFFNQSSALIIVVINVLILNKIDRIKKGEV